MRQVAADVDAHGAHSTVGDWFAGRGLPSASSQSLFVKLVVACGVREPDDIEQWLDAWRRVRRAPGRRAGGREPYRGLASFQPEDVDWFFGRSELVRRLLDGLVGLTAEGGGVQLVVGASGSGKSSFLRAGLLPAVRQGRLDGTGWVVILICPGREPVGELAAALAAHGGGPDATDRAAAIRADPAAFAHMLLELSPPADGTSPHPVDDATPRRILVVVDQLEEAFTVCTEARERDLFIAALSAAAQRAGALVVLGVRADFYAHVLADRRLLASVERSQFTVGPMTEAELRDAIVEPARKARIDIEDGLVELLLREVVPRDGSSGFHNAGVLPLLSHALYATWQHGDGRRMTIASYREIGGIDGAVAATADHVYDQLSQPQRQLARRLFLGLIHIGLDTADTRRRVPTAELLADFADDDKSQLEEVLYRFVAHRLITVDANTVEICHEAIVLAWPALRDWLDHDRAGAAIGRRLADDAASWRRENHDPAILYRGTRLVAAQSWVEDHGADVSATALAFLHSSTAQARRRARRLYQVIAALTTLAVLTCVLAAVALKEGSESNRQRQEAVRQRNEAISRLAAGRADKLRRADVSLAMQISLAAYRIAPTVEARSSLLDAFVTPAVNRLRGFASAAQAVSFSPDGRTLAAGGVDHSVRLWFADGSHYAVGPVLRGPTKAVYAVAFSPGGRVIAAAGADTRVYLWDMIDPGDPHPWPAPLLGPTSTVYSLAFSPDGRTLFAGSDDKTVYRWSMNDRHEVVGLPPLAAATDAIQSVAVSPDGRVLAIGSADQTVRLWDIAPGAQPSPLGAPLKGHTHKVFAVAFSPDGKTLASGSADTTVRLWDITSPRAPRYRGTLSGHTSWINSLVFSPDGTTIAAGSSDKTVTTWDLATGQLTARLPHPQQVSAITYGPDDHTIASTGIDGIVRVWSLPGPNLAGPTDAIFNVSIGQNGSTLAAASRDRTIRQWTITNRRSPAPLGPVLVSDVPGQSFGGTLAISPDGRVLAVGTRTGPVQLWDITVPARPTRLGAPLSGPTKLVQVVAFSPDGHVLAAAGDDTNIYLWTVMDSGRAIPVATIPGNSPHAAVFVVTFLYNGRLIAAAGTDGTVRLFDISDPRTPIAVGPPLAVSSNDLYGVAFNPDGTVMAAAGADKKIRLWDVRNPAEPTPIGAPLVGPTSTVYWVTFSPDGHTLAAAVIDGTMWLWDTHDARAPGLSATLTATSESLFAVAFSPDGRTLIGAGADNMVHLWDVDPERVAAWICATSGDPITEDEWKQYLTGAPYDPPCAS